MNVNFTWDLRIGDVVIFVGALATAGSFLFRSGGSLVKLQEALTHALEQIAELKEDVAKMGVVLIELAVQKEQIGMLMKWYDELRRGTGYIPRAPRGGIDGEYK